MMMLTMVRRGTLRQGLLVMCGRGRSTSNVAHKPPYEPRGDDEDDRERDTALQHISIVKLHFAYWAGFASNLVLQALEQK
jgi:hypothetical protein